MNILGESPLGKLTFFLWPSYWDCLFMVNLILTSLLALCYLFWREMGFSLGSHELMIGTDREHREHASRILRPI